MGRPVGYIAKSRDQRLRAAKVTGGCGRSREVALVTSHPSPLNRNAQRRVLDAVFVRGA